MLKNLATVHVGRVKTFMSLHTSNLALRELYTHDHSTCISIKKTEESSVILQAEDVKRLEWEFDKCCSDPDRLSFNEERRTLVNLVLEGHDVASLFVEVGGTYTSFKLKQEQKKLIIDDLANALDPMHTKIEFAFFGFTDTYCYDLRRNVVCATDILIERGIDYWMKQVNSIDDVWTLVSRGSKIPSVLKIKVYNSSTKRYGSFFMFDLLEPKFIELLQDTSAAAAVNSNGISSCFDNLRFLIKSITEPTDQDSLDAPVITDYYLLTHLISKFICSQGQLIVFGHMKQCLKYQKRESIMLLDFLNMLRRIKVASLANSLAAVNKSHHNYKLDEYKNKLQVANSDILKKQSFLIRFKSACQQLSNLLNQKEMQQKDLLDQYEQKRQEELMKIRSRVYHKRGLLIHKHRNTLNKIKELAISKIANLKKQLDKIEKERDRWKQKYIRSVKLNNCMKIKQGRLIEFWKKKESELLREIDIFRSEKDEFIELFRTLEDALVVKNIDLNK